MIMWSHTNLTLKQSENLSKRSLRKLNKNIDAFRKNLESPSKSHLASNTVNILLSLRSPIARSFLKASFKFYGLLQMLSHRTTEIGRLFGFLNVPIFHVFVKQKRPETRFLRASSIFEFFYVGNGVFSYGTTLSFWDHIIIKGPHYYLGTTLLSWDHIIILGPHYPYRAPIITLKPLKSCEMPTRKR